MCYPSMNEQHLKCVPASMQKYAVAKNGFVRAAYNVAKAIQLT